MVPFFQGMFIFEENITIFPLISTVKIMSDSSWCCPWRRGNALSVESEPCGVCARPRVLGGGVTGGGWEEVDGSRPPKQNSH